MKFRRLRPRQSERPVAEMELAAADSRSLAGGPRFEKLQRLIGNQAVSRLLGETGPGGGQPDRRVVQGSFVTNDYRTLGGRNPYLRELAGSGRSKRRTREEGQLSGNVFQLRHEASRLPDRGSDWEPGSDARLRSQTPVRMHASSRAPAAEYRVPEGVWTGFKPDLRRPDPGAGAWNSRLKGACLQLSEAAARSPQAMGDSPVIAKEGRAVYQVPELAARKPRLWQHRFSGVIRSSSAQWKQPAQLQLAMKLPPMSSRPQTGGGAPAPGGGEQADPSRLIGRQLRLASHLLNVHEPSGRAVLDSAEERTNEAAARMDDGFRERLGSFGLQERLLMEASIMAMYGLKDLIRTRKRRGRRSGG